MDHLTQGELESLAMGFTADVDEARLRHLAACPECTRALALEARLELDLHAAAAAPAIAAPPRHERTWSAIVWRFALPAAAALLVVALGVRFLADRHLTAPHGPPARPALAVSADSPCLADPRNLGPAHDTVAPTEYGRFVVVPDRMGMTD